MTIYKIRLSGLALIILSIFLTVPAIAQSRIFLSPDKKNETDSTDSNRSRLFIPKETGQHKQRSYKKKNARSVKTHTSRSRTNYSSKSKNRFDIYKRAQDVPSALLNAGSARIENVEELMLVAAAHRTAAMGHAIKNRKARQARIAKKQKLKDQAKRHERIWSAAVKNKAQAKKGKPVKQIYKSKDETHKKPRRLFLQNR